VSSSLCRFLRKRGKKKGGHKEKGRLKVFEVDVEVFSCAFTEKGGKKGGSIARMRGGALAPGRRR